MNLRKSFVAAACGLGVASVLFATTLVAQGGGPIVIPSSGNVPVPPAGQAYLGGAINDPSLCPSGGCTGTFNQQLAQMTDAFEQPSNFNRTLAIHMLYYNFDDLFATSNTWSVQQDPRLTDDFSHGRVPIISWNCTGTNTSINNDSNQTTNNGKTTVYYSTGDVANGRWDSIIWQAAENLKNLQRPVYLRYFWEMNIATGKNTICENSNSLTLSQIEQNYRNAFERIVDIFRAAGANNVSFIWSTWAGTAYSHYFDSVYPDGLGFYPGPEYVDWIGVDIYDATTNAANDFTTAMTSNFVGVGAYDKSSTAGPHVYETYTNPWLYGDVWNGLPAPPIMISETGALYDTSEQVNYLTSIQQDLASDYPAIRAISYFNKNDIQDWLLGTGEPYIGTGMSAFTTMGQAEGFKCWYNNSEGETNCW